MSKQRGLGFHGLPGPSTECKLNGLYGCYYGFRAIILHTFRLLGFGSKGFEVERSSTQLMGVVGIKDHADSVILAPEPDYLGTSPLNPEHLNH